jgi:hypothetical protein
MMTAMALAMVMPAVVIAPAMAGPAAATDRVTEVRADCGTLGKAFSEGGVLAKGQLVQW